MCPGKTFPKSAADGKQILPDKALHGVPFAALWDSRSSRYLIQDYRIACAPSATLYVAPRPGTAQPGYPRLPALVIGNPAFDVNLWPGLESLRGTEKESARIARLLPGSVLVRGAEATKASFLDLAPRSGMVHFAGHAVTDPRDPLLSQLVLAPSGAGDSGALSAWEIYRLDLTGTRLVVLSACGTADAVPAADEGGTSLARAFLAVGVPQVVASLWNVDDRTADRFFAVFYKSLLARPDPVGALREAQSRSWKAAKRSTGLPGLGEPSRSSRPTPFNPDRSTGDRQCPSPSG